MVIHYTGDIHQPLHSTALVDSKYPKGDAGGNFEHIPSESGVSNLHSVWDSVIYNYAGFVDLPMNDKLWSYYGTECDNMVEPYPVPAAKLHPGDFEVWAGESFDASVSTVYPTFKSGQKPDDVYRAAAEPIARSRIMYGGARLAELMVEIFG